MKIGGNFMPDVKTIVGKLQAGNLQILKLYPQDPTVDIDTLLNDILTQLWTDVSNNALAQDEIDLCSQIFANAIITNLVDKGAQADLDLLFTNSLSCYSNGKIDTIYLSQLLRQNKMPEPSSKCVYIVNDVCDAAKQYDSVRDAQTKSALLANLGAFYNNATALFVLMDDNTDLDNFKMLVNPMLKSAGVNEIPVDFTIDNKIFDGIMLRSDYKLVDQSNDPNSEARIIASVLSKAYPHVILPTKTIESLIPTTIVFFNAKKLARATSSEILSAKNDLSKLMALDRSRILSFSKMASLTQVTKAVNKMNMMQNQLNNVLAKSAVSTSTGKFVIKDINMSRVKKKLIKVMKKMKNVDVSKNPTYHNFDTYQRPNRRDPGNPDLPGTSMDLGYYPDIHLYVDTSGSISQKDYEDSVAMIIDIAKKLNCDIYFNSFTTDISQETVVRCRNRSKSQIQRDIERIPKLSGGTTIDQVWSYINHSKKNKRQLSILISDFYVDVPRYIPHPENLYYIPTKDTSVSYAEKFAQRLPNPWRVWF